MLGKMLHSVGLRSVHLHVASLASVLLCLALWIRAKTMDQDERSNAERRAKTSTPADDSRCGDNRAVAEDP